MGGGDLNSKKSWHPHTLKNQEQVWKAEQAKALEEKKLNDLRKEIQEERNMEELKRVGRESGVLGGIQEGDKKLDWMYKNSHDLINRDEYLLGRKVDKSFEMLQAEEQQKEKPNLVGVKQPLNHVEHECVPFSIRAYKNLQITEQVDLQRKFMEDPLMLIKQREMESRRKILENPVKLKELHRMLKTDEKLKKVAKKSKKSKKNKKSKKKHKKRSKSTSSSSESQSEDESDSDLDSKLAKKLKGDIFDEEDILKKGINLTKLLDSKYEKISQELDKAAGKSKKRSKKKKSNKESDNSSPENSGEDDRKQSKSYSRSNFSKDEKSDTVSRERNYRNLKDDRARSPISNYNNKNMEQRHSSSLFRLKGNYQQRYRHDYNSRSRSNSVSRAKPGGTNENRTHSSYRERNLQRSRSDSRCNDYGGRADRNKSKSPTIIRSYGKTSKRVSRSRSRNKSRSRSKDLRSRNKYPQKLSSLPRRSRSKSPNRRRSRSRSRNYQNRSRNEPKSPRRSRSRSQKRKSSRSPQRSHKSYNKEVSHKPPSTTSTQRPARLTEEEKQAKLREMMSNAEWREEERSHIVRKHREAYAREEEQNK